MPEQRHLLSPHSSTKQNAFCLFRRPLSIMTNSVTLVSSELYHPTERRLSEKIVSSFADRGGCRVVSAEEPYGRNLHFLNRSLQWRIVFMYQGKINSSKCYLLLLHY
jgi:hypothetical protein